MDFGDILAQWEEQTGKPYGKKRLKQDKKRKKTTALKDENTKKPNPIDVWIRRNGIEDKDAMQQQAYKSSALKQAEKKRIHAMYPQDTIDLHGMTQQEAYQKLMSFFEVARAKRLKKIAIIHGKGNHSKGMPVLAAFVKIFLEDHPNAGKTEHPKAKDGGSGTTWVILKYSR